MNILTQLIPVFKNNLSDVLALRNTKVKKPDDSYVSKGDLLMDKLCIDFLNQTFSSIQIITEETYRGGEIDLNESEYIAVVDPIDGTENFVSGLSEWGNGVTLYKGNQFVEALIALPELNQYLHSEDKIEKIFDSRIHGISSSLTKEEIMKLETGFEYRIIGCCMYNMYNVVTGRYKKFNNPKGAKSWDILPGLNIALKQGLEVLVENKIYNGEFLQPSKTYCFGITN